MKGGTSFGWNARNWDAIWSAMEELASCECTFELFFFFCTWAPHWKAFFLKLIHAGLSIDASQSYKSLQSLESKILLKDLLGAKDSEEYGQHLRRWVSFFLIQFHAHLIYIYLWVGMLFLLFRALRMAREFGTWIKKLWKKTRRLIIVSASMFVFVTKCIVLYYRYYQVSNELLYCWWDFSWPWVIVDRTLQVPLLLYCFARLLTGLKGPQ